MATVSDDLKTFRSSQEYLDSLKEDYEERLKNFTKEQWKDFEAVQHLLTTQQFFTIDGSHDKWVKWREDQYEKLHSEGKQKPDEQKTKRNKKTN